MDEKQRLKLIKDFIYLRDCIDQRVNEFITEKIMKREIAEEDLDALKNSIDYVMDDQLRHITRSLKK
jgi:hypothetical protein